MGAQVRVNVPSLPVVSSPALSRVRNKRQEKSARCLGLCTRILMGVPKRYKRSLHSPSRATYLSNSHCNYSDQRPVSQLNGFWELPGVWALNGPVFVKSGSDHHLIPVPAIGTTNPACPKTIRRSHPMCLVLFHPATSRSQEAGPSGILLRPLAQRLCGSVPAPTGPPPQPPPAPDGPS